MDSTLTGRELGNYVLGALIGRGGMGEVYAAKHRFLATDVAVKILRSALAESETVAHRFFLEARAAVEIAHPNVVRVLDFGKTTEGTLYLVMERLYGRSLRAEIACGALPTGHAAYIAMQVCAGLGAAHKKGIVHRDLKPDNVFLTATEVKVLDFGIARVLSQVSATSQGTVMGTPLYIAPEQLRSSQSAGPSSDVYSLGAMLFEMLTGRTPYQGESVPQLFASHLFDVVPKLRSFISAHAELEAIVERCLAKEAHERPRSMEELATLLAPFAADTTSVPPSRELPTEPVNVLAPTDDIGRISTLHPAGQSLDLSTLSRAASEMRTNERTENVRSPRWWRVAPIVALVALGVGGYAISGRSGPPARPVVAATKPVTQPAAATPVETPQPAVAPPKVDLVLRSNPPGARVMVGQDDLGTTPLVIQHAVPFTVMFSLPNYQNEVVTLTDPGDSTVSLRRLHRDQRQLPVSASPMPMPQTVKPKGESLD